jgi:hypothetical protein
MAAATTNQANPDHESTDSEENAMHPARYTPLLLELSHPPSGAFCSSPHWVENPPPRHGLRRRIARLGQCSGMTPEPRG